MRDRLIKLIRQAKKHTKNAISDIERDMIFADYLLANGVIVPPCKVGDTVYINDILGVVAKPYEIVHITTDTDSEGIDFYFEAYPKGEKLLCRANLRYFYDNSIGKTVFLTREEAEQALKERRE